MFERFSTEARQVVIGAQQAARDLHHNEIRPEHLLISMLRPQDETDSLAVRVLREHGVEVTDLTAGAPARPGTPDDANPAGLTDEQVTALGAVGIDVGEVTRRVEEVFGPGALDAPATAPQAKRRRWFLGGTHIPFTSAAKKILELSLREALALKHRSIGAEHILLGLLRADAPGPAAETLRRRGVTHATVRARIATGHRDAA